MNTWLAVSYGAVPAWLACGVQARLKVAAIEWHRKQLNCLLLAL